MIERMPQTPLDHFKQTFTPLYGTLLVLGSVAALMSLLSLTSLRSIIEQFTNDPAYATGALISTLIVPALMIASLILLWHKHPAGLRLRLIGYGMAITASVIGLFTSPETIERTTKEVIEATLQQNASSVITPELATTITEASFYSSLYLSIGASLLFARLWTKAWKKQVKVDTKKKSPSSN